MDKQLISGSKLRTYKLNWPILTNNQLKEGHHHRTKRQIDIKITCYVMIKQTLIGEAKNKLNLHLEWIFLQGITRLIPCMNRISYRIIIKTVKITNLIRYKIIKSRLIWIILIQRLKRFWLICQFHRLLRFFHKGFHNLKIGYKVCLKQELRLFMWTSITK
jgi:hypothetical protein